MHIHVEEKYSQEDQGLPHLEIKSEEIKNSAKDSFS